MRDPPTGVPVSELPDHKSAQCPGSVHWYQLVGDGDRTGACALFEATSGRARQAEDPLDLGNDHHKLRGAPFADYAVEPDGNSIDHDTLMAAAANTYALGLLASA